MAGARGGRRRPVAAHGAASGTARARLVALPADENRWGNGGSADRWRLAHQHAAEQAAAMNTMTETGDAEAPRINEPLPTAGLPR